MSLFATSSWLEMQRPAYWGIKLLASHNNYYPLKVLMETPRGGCPRYFPRLLLQTLPDDDERVPDVKKRLRVLPRGSRAHRVGEKRPSDFEEKPWLKTPYYGLVECRMPLPGTCSPSAFNPFYVPRRRPSGPR